MLKAGSHNRPQLPVLVVEQEHGSAVGLQLRAGNLQNQLQQLGEIESGIQQARRLE